VDKSPVGHDGRLCLSWANASGGTASAMRISITVHPSSKREVVEQQSDGTYIVRVKAAAEKGRANVAAEKLLSRHFSSNARIVSGFRSHHKVVEVE
jgi:uncharacterized protein YggU (UPF0235/DUF167 family)